MLKTLRNRLVLSHVLPVLIIIPLMGIVLVYVLESQFALPALARSLESDARLMARLVQDREEIWQDPQQAQQLLRNVQPENAARVTLLDADARLLASSDADDSGRLLQPVDNPNVRLAQTGQVVRRIDYSQRLQGEVIDIVVPVLNDQDQLQGMLRMTFRYTTVAEELLQLRYLIAGIVFLGLLLGGVIGFLLALSVNAPIQQVTRAVYDIARGDRQEPLPEQGPEEIRLQLRAVNFLVMRLQNLEEARRHLLANLVHELGRPLGALRVGLQALQRGAKADPALLDDMLAGMDEHLATLQRLLDDLAHLHGRVLGSLELQRETVALSEWLPVVLRPWQAAAEEKQQTWIVDVPPRLPPISADRARLGQAIGNLVSNAIKYTPQGGTMRFTAAADAAQVWLRVQDSGPGIPPEEQQVIFQSYYRGSQRGRIKQGMGLGLGIAQDIVAAHGGHIDVVSEPGRGSTFTICLPLAQTGDA